MRKHNEELHELENNVRLNSNGQFAEGRPDYYDDMIMTTAISTPTRAYKALMKRVLFREDKQRKDRIVEDEADPDAQEVSGRSQKPLVAGGMAWTAEEGDLFFQGLKRFGKHSVWAIQEHIKTRSLAEVVTMIQTMEAELARRRYFGLEVIRMSEMPMAEEADDEQVELEERCAEAILDQETKTYWKQRDMELSRYKVRSLCMSNDLFRPRCPYFNHRVLTRRKNLDYLTGKLSFILLDALKKWLRAILTELYMVQQERRRVNLVLNKFPNEFHYRYNPFYITAQDVLRTLYAQRKPIYSNSFFDTVPERLFYTDTEKWSDMETQSDEWMSDEEEIDLQKTDEGSVTPPDQRPTESNFEYLHLADPVKRSPDIKTETSAAADHLATLKTMAPSKRKRKWTGKDKSPESADMSSLDNLDPVITGHPRLDRQQRLRDKIVECKGPSWATLGKDEKSTQHPEESWCRNVQIYEEQIEDMARVIPQVRLEEMYAPGYGILPNNASFLHDVTRAPPKNGYGLGERDAGGLWLMDMNPTELFHDDGYITMPFARFSVLSVCIGERIGTTCLLFL
ncbi:hypothetical protein BGZ65_007740 [Modicella reniformis]|uniref:Uncharacterized protein n=1 Tax=Modicella reniformis TaxID=1440133 RepID=A0A9P6MKW3_9FUNG|nr:hypothetical protein BGZ65_007740 [Modicella reniformis]